MRNPLPVQVLLMRQGNRLQWTLQPPIRCLSFMLLRYPTYPICTLLKCLWLDSVRPPQMSMTCRYLRCTINGSSPAVSSAPL